MTDKDLLPEVLCHHQLRKSRGSGSTPCQQFDSALVKCESTFLDEQAIGVAAWVAG